MHLGRSDSEGAEQGRVETVACIGVVTLDGRVENRSRRLGERSRHRTIGGETVLAVERQLVARKQGRGVHVVLQQRVGNDHVADARALVQAAGGAREERVFDAEFAGKQGRRGRGGDLADAREHGNDLVAVEMADPEGATGANHRNLVGHQPQQGGQLLMHRADDGDAAHGCARFESMASV